MPTVYSSESNAKSIPKASSMHTSSKQYEHIRPLAAFAERPDDVRFETQEAEETVELFLRQHPIVNVPWIVLSAVILLTPTILFPIFTRLAPFNVPVQFIFVFTLFWYVATYGFILTNILRWYFNIYIVTNERIVDIDFKYLLYKHFAQAELSKIQDISFTSSGVMATVFNYGNVSVQTAGESPNIEFEMVPYPQKVVETIRSLQENVGGGNV